MSGGFAGLTPELKAKLLQMEEQLQLAIQDYPERITIERVRFALALAKFVRGQLDFDATVEQSAPPGLRVGRAPNI